MCSFRYLHILYPNKKDNYFLHLLSDYMIKSFTENKKKTMHCICYSFYFTLSIISHHTAWNHLLRKEETNFSFFPPTKKKSIKIFSFLFQNWIQEEWNFRVLIFYLCSIIYIGLFVLIELIKVSFIYCYILYLNTLQNMKRKINKFG